MFESLSAYKNVYRELLISPQQDWLNWIFYIFENFTKKKKWNWSFPPLSRNKIYQFSRLDFSPCSLWASSEVSQLSVFPVWTVVGVFTHNATEISPENILQGIRVLALSPFCGSNSGSETWQQRSLSTISKACQHTLWVGLPLQIPKLPWKS